MLRMNDNNKDCKRYEQKVVNNKTLKLQVKDFISVVYLHG